VLCRGAPVALACRHEIEGMTSSVTFRDQGDEWERVPPTNAATLWDPLIPQVRAHPGKTALGRRSS
jgi:hypothetical protein